ncbi:MAG: hypothetical protein ACT4N2_08580 [Hyphomicrobium sp.]
MFMRTITVLIASAFVLATVPPEPVDARLGIKRILRVPKKIVRAPVRVLKAVRPDRILRTVIRPVVRLPVRLGWNLRKRYGILPVLVIGPAILHRLSPRHQAEATKRAKVVVEKDPDSRVVDTYEIKDKSGEKSVTIIAEPSQKAIDFKDDPAFTLTAALIEDPVPASGKSADTTQDATARAPEREAGPQSAPEPQPDQQTTPTDTKLASGEAPAATGTSDTKIVDLPQVKLLSATDTLRISEIAPDTKCRKVVTEFQIKPAAKGKTSSKEKTADGTTATAEVSAKQPEGEKSSNTVIFCQTPVGEWKPASA